jgi:hypothetical protein
MNEEYYLGNATILFELGHKNGTGTVTGKVIIPQLMFLSDSIIVVTEDNKQVAVMMKNIIKMEMDFPEEYWVKVDSMKKDVLLRQKNREYEMMKMEESIDRETKSNNQNMY